MDIGAWQATVHRGRKESDTTQRLSAVHTWICTYDKNSILLYIHSSVQFSRSVVSNSLWTHEPQHARPPCPLPTPRVYPNSCPSSQRCHPAISSQSLRIKTSEIWSFPRGSDSKESTRNAGVLGSIPRLGRCPGGGHGNPLQYSCLENPHGQRNPAGDSL